MKKRPFGVWIAGLYAFYKTATYLFGTVVLFSVAYLYPELLPETGQILMANMTPVLALLAWANLLVMLAAGVSLFMLKRVAIHLFLVSLALTLASSVYGLIVQPELVELATDSSSIPFYVDVAISVGIRLAIVVYCCVLARRGVLAATRGTQPGCYTPEADSRGGVARR